MDSKLIVLIFFIICFSFILFQSYEFIMNYDYILNFNNVYANYEYASSPSYNYTDYTIYDPNDLINNVEDKWKCVLYTNQTWVGVSKKGLVTIDDRIATWSDKMSCIKYIFDQTLLKYTDMCESNLTNSYCVFQKVNSNK